MADNNNGAKTDTLVVKVNKELREDFRSFCAERGISISSAASLFIRALMKTEDFSFYNVVPNKKYLPACGVVMGFYLQPELRSAFAKFCVERGYKASTVVRSFMVYCVQTGEMWRPEG